MAKTLPEVLGGLLTEKGWNYSDLFRESGVHVSAVSLIMRGRTRSPEIETLRKLAAAFGIDVQTLLDAQAETERRGRLELVRVGAPGGGATPSTFPHPRRAARGAPPTDAGPGPAGLEPALAGAAPERRPGLAPAELGPAGFVTRAEFDNLRTIMTRIARKVGVTLGAAICAFVLTTPAAAEAPTVGARGHMTAHGASGMSLIRRWTRRAVRWLTDGALRYRPCNLSPA